MMMDIIWMETSGGSSIFSWEAYPEMGTFIVWKGPDFFMVLMRSIMD